MSISDYSTTPASNTSISGINIAEGCSPGGLNDAIRQLMADIAAAAIEGIIPSGIITKWSGSIATIPSGWALCNGANGTPDLRDKFSVGAGGVYAVGATGGVDSVTLTSAQIPVHAHAAGSLATVSAGTHTHGGVAEFRNDTDRGIGNGSVISVDDAGQTLPAGEHTHSITGSTANAGSGASHENRPPYYALAYIMKL